MQRRIKMRPNIKRILESILLLIEYAEESKTYLTQYEIVKSLFVADIRHLNEYGRPITFDNYSALEFGPVPSESYEMLKPSYDGARYFGEPWPLWDRLPSPQDSPSAYKFVRPKRLSNRRILSKSDMTAIKGAMQDVKRLRFKGVRDWTHDHPAYKAAWRESGPRMSYEMDYSLLFTTPDESATEDLAHASKYI